jgi:hypothetical protein
VTVVTVLVSGAALFQARRVSRRLERLSDAYWELRYEYGQLRARLNRLEGTDTDSVEPGPPANFVPLSSLKR